jgi:quercetin dioxygenase-like cupin family protein
VRHSGSSLSLPRRRMANRPPCATFGPGVVSHWHSHPLGQILLVISGVGQVQREGGVVTEVRAGDCIWFAPGERHWHGAAPGSVFSYVSIQTVDQGTAVYWLGPVENPDQIPQQ